ncbi:MAG TPA: alpha/beta fold hydrolase [Polyangiaceae bacterium]
MTSASLGRSRSESASSQQDQPQALGQAVQLKASDGVPLVGRVFEPAGRSRASLLALPGIGVPQRVFRHAAAWLRQRGVRVVSMDYRGVGESVHPDACPTASLTAWATRDAVCGLDFVRSTYDDAPVLLAHSFGGQILGLADELRGVRRAILVGSQLGHPQHWRGWSRVQVEFFWRCWLPLAGLVSDPLPRWALGERLPLGVARQWRAWATSGDWLFEEFPDARDRFADFRAPLLMCSSRDDTIAPPHAVRALLACFRSAPTDLIDIESQRVGHVGFFRPGFEWLWERWLDFAVSR